MTTNLFVIVNIKQLRTDGSFRILLPFFWTSSGVGVLNSAIFNSFYHRVEFGTILEGLRNFGEGVGGLNTPTPLSVPHCWLARFAIRPFAPCVSVLQSRWTSDADPAGNWDRIVQPHTDVTPNVHSLRKQALEVRKLDKDTVEPWIASIIRSRNVLVIQNTRISKWIFP